MLPDTLFTVSEIIMANNRLLVSVLRYAWGQDAFDRAKQEDKPIFLSGKLLFTFNIQGRTLLSKATQYNGSYTAAESTTQDCLHAAIRGGEGGRTPLSYRRSRGSN